MYVSMFCTNTSQHSVQAIKIENLFLTNKSRINVPNINFVLYMRILISKTFEENCQINKLKLSSVIYIMKLNDLHINCYYNVNSKNLIIQLMK